jgi:hypothetical protein
LEEVEPARGEHEQKEKEKKRKEKKRKEKKRKEKKRKEKKKERKKKKDDVFLPLCWLKSDLDSGLPPSCFNQSNPPTQQSLLALPAKNFDFPPFSFPFLFFFFFSFGAFLNCFRGVSSLVLLLKMAVGEKEEEEASTVIFITQGSRRKNYLFFF